MKDYVKKVRTFLTFDAPLEIEYISAQFATTHSQHQQQIPEWGYQSTRQRLIANCWCTDVLAHFASMTDSIASCGVNCRHRNIRDRMLSDCVHWR
jgi:hypothetical protein